MGTGLTRLYLFLAILVFIFAVIGFYLAFKSALPETPAQNSTNSQATLPLSDTSTKVSLEVIKKQRLLIVRWQYLPTGTSALNIFRSRTGTNNWNLWKAVDIPQGTLISGSLEIKLSAGETTEGYSYYAQVSSSSGQALWTASSTPVTYLENLPVTTNTTIGPTPLPPPISVNSTSTVQTTTNTPSITPPSSQTNTSPTEQPGVTYYYSPELVLTSSSTDVSAHFNVDHIDKTILISWQNIPNDTDLVIVSRSKTQNGNFTELLRQENPASAYSIRLADETVYKDYYYKFEAFANNSITATYGPILLLGL